MGVRVEKEKNISFCLARTEIQLDRPAGLRPSHHKPAAGVPENPLPPIGDVERPVGARPVHQNHLEVPLLAEEIAESSRQGVLLVSGRNDDRDSHPGKLLP